MPKFLSPNTRDVIVAHNLDLISATKIDVTDEMMLLAQQLSRIHGRIRVTNESSGIHFYMPSPICLEEYGPDELDKMHLAVNVKKYFEQDEDLCGCCMKTSTPYRMSDLLSMVPLSERGYDVKSEVLKIPRCNIDFMERDPNGAWIPKGPGTVIPVFKLPNYHPAQQYLRSRHFDAETLWEQFRLSYCVHERKDVFYSRMLGGFKKSPQGCVFRRISDSDPILVGQ
jgi:hypothetical protein